jgi:hypothetical protein
VPVNPGGEPGRDDGGLPPVDIEIPDDARELDREVLAYRREQRARRRRARWDRILGPLRGHGALLPLVAGCVALSMLAGTLLSVFSISPASAPVLSRSAPPASRPAASRPAPVPASRSASEPASRLPVGTVAVNGKIIQVRSLRRVVLALVPAGCGCGQTLRQVTTQAARARVPVYLVATPSAMLGARALARTVGQGTAVVAKDEANVLGSAYHHAGLTIVLVRPDASATVHWDLPEGVQLEDELRTLGTVARSAAPEPGPANSASPAAA